MDTVADLLSFLDASPSPSHAAREIARRLAAAGFQTLDPAATWDLAPGRYVLRRGATVIALVLSSRRIRRFTLVGAHTDSPHLRLKPRAAYTCEHCLQLGVEVYGSALAHTWLDRDLGLAGEVWTRDGLCLPVRLARPLARVASLAIHLDRRLNDDGLKLNPQLHLAPLWGLATGTDAGEEFAALIAGAAGIAPADLAATDLSLYDLTPATRGGAKDELVFSGRLDNLASCHAGLTAIVGANAAESADSAQVLACFDHEEIGSESAEGADGSLLGQVLERVALGCGLDRAAYLAALAGSRMLSADMAHAVHPNWPDRHEPRHRPRLGGGIVLKSNHNRRYATDGAGAAHAHACARRAGIALQDFVARTDLGCGSTIGPAVAANLGISCVDVGAPMLSMHSARECAAAADQADYAALMREHLRS